MSVKSFIYKCQLLKGALRSQNGVQRRIKFIQFFLLANNNKVVPFRLPRIAQEYTNDFFAETGISQIDKMWFYKKGYATYKVHWYGLNKDNYNDYISDFDFYNHDNYTNRDFVYWFDNKLNTYFLLSEFKDWMPKHYFYKKKTALLPLDTDKDIITLLEETALAVKACKGGHGIGFYKIEKIQDTYLVNGVLKSKNEVLSFIEGLDNYIITKFSVPHKVFRDACGENAFAVIRAVSVYSEKDGPQIVAMIIRLGTKNSGYVCDYDGTINCGIDLETGRLYEAVERFGDADGIIVPKTITTHPDTNVILDGLRVPDYSKLCSIVSTITAHLPMTPYLVMDIIPTDEGFEILEINSHGQLRMLERWFPARKNKYIREVLKTIDR